MDAEPPGVHAGEVATELAGRLGCPLTLVTVLAGASSREEADLERLVPHGSEGRSIQHRMDEAKSRAVARGVPSVEVVYLHGAVAEAILRYLDGNPPDLVVVGTRGLSRGSRLFLGSVSTRLVSEAPCPVLVVRTVRGRRKAADKPAGAPSTHPSA
jgi:nucleotide-binding universal stress UspA family protein